MGDTSAVIERVEETETLVRFLKRTARLDAASPTALYRRVQEALRAAIDGKVLAPGAAIPGERDLAARLGLSRITVRQAIKGLVEDGLLVQRHGARTSVADRFEKPLSLLTSFSQDMTGRGHRPGATWLKAEVGPALPAEALALGLSPASEVCRLHRLRTADGVPMALERSIVPRAYLRSPDLVADSLYAALEAAGHSPVRALQRIRSDVAMPEEARLLGISPGASLLDVERRCFLADGAAVEYCRSRYRGDTYDFMVELQVPGRGAGSAGKA
jgi:GntR family transcriptional regulator